MSDGAEMDRLTRWATEALDEWARDGERMTDAELMAHRRALVIEEAAQFATLDEMWLWASPDDPELPDILAVEMHIRDDDVPDVLARMRELGRDRDFYLGGD